MPWCRWAGAAPAHRSRMGTGGAPGRVARVPLGAGVGMDRHVLPAVRRLPARPRPPSLASLPSVRTRCCAVPPSPPASACAMQNSAASSAPNGTTSSPASAAVRCSLSRPPGRAARGLCLDDGPHRRRRACWSSANSTTRSTSSARWPTPWPRSPRAASCARWCSRWPTAASTPARCRAAPTTRRPAMRSRLAAGARLALGQLRPRRDGGRARGRAGVGRQPAARGMRAAMANTSLDAAVTRRDRRQAHRRHPRRPLRPALRGDGPRHAGSNT